MTKLVLIPDFFRRNTNATSKNSLRTVFGASSIANGFRVYLCVVKFPNSEQVTDVSMENENGISLVLNTQDFSVKNTSTTDLYDVSRVFDDWKLQEKNSGKLHVVFNVSDSARRESRKRVLRKWRSMIKDGEWVQSGPVFLVVYFKNTAKARLLTLPNPSVNEALAHKLRTGIPSTCKLYSFRKTFAQLGLSKVYVSPRGSVDLGVCYGSCSPTISVDSRVSFMSTHAWMLELARKKGTSTRSRQSCCVPIEYKGLRVAKQDPPGSRNVVYVVISDFIASKCGCR